MFIKARNKKQGEDVVIVGFVADGDRSWAICVDKCNHLVDCYLHALEVDYEECLKRCEDELPLVGWKREIK